MRYVLSVVSSRVEARVREDFAVGGAEAAIRRLDALNLPMPEKQSRERIQAAIVLLAGGDADRFEYSATLAETDWRDVLVFSGLGDDDWGTTTRQGTRATEYRQTLLGGFDEIPAERACAAAETRRSNPKAEKQE